MFVMRNPALGLSLVRHERPIVIAQPNIREPQRNISETLTSEIGGFIGIGKTTSTSTIMLSKDQFFAGEQLNVTIDCDNSRCSKAIKSFKIKVQRNLLALGYNGDFTNQKKYIKEYRSNEGCEANANRQITLNLQLPFDDDEENELLKARPYLKQSLQTQVSQDEQDVLKVISPSMMGQIVSIFYELHVFVKHSAWNEFG